jgi:hypothetical protein
MDAAIYSPDASNRFAFVGMKTSEKTGADSFTSVVVKRFKKRHRACLMFWRARTMRFAYEWSCRSMKKAGAGSSKKRTHFCGRTHVLARMS